MTATVEQSAIITARVRTNLRLSFLHAPYGSVAQVCPDITNRMRSHSQLLLFSFSFPLTRQPSFSIVSSAAYFVCVSFVIFSLSVYNCIIAQAILTLGYLIIK